MIAHHYPELQQQLSLLKRKQRKMQSRYLWRSLFVSAFSGGILFAVIFPHWQIKDPSQITIEGGNSIEPSAIYETLNINYPQSIATIPTRQVENRLESMSIVESVRVTKTIFPPLVKINIRERVPIATAVSSGKIGFLDYQGVWLDPNLYESELTKLPSLTDVKVTNFQTQHGHTWAKVYDLMLTYPQIGIREVYWDEVGHLFLVTKNFQVFLGSNTSLLKAQFATLASFPELNTHKKLRHITQVDLTNPNAPLIDR